MIMEWIDAAAAISLAAFVNGFWLGVLLACGAWAFIGMLSKRTQVNATTRYIVWATVLVMCVGMVLWRGWQESSEVVRHDVEKTRLEVVQSVGAGSEPVRVQAGAQSRVATVAPANAVDAAAVQVAPTESVVQSPTAGESVAEVVTEPVEGRFRVEGPALSVAGRRVIFSIWGAITALLLMRIAIGFMAVQRLKRRSEPAPEKVNHALQHILSRLHRPRLLEVGLSNEIDTAVAVGFFRPMILLPNTMLDTLTAEELEQVLVHEAAHIQRYDDLAMFLQRIVMALFFFHPGVYLAARLMDRDREFACDDWVLAFTRRPKAYATCLARLVSVRSGGGESSFMPAFSSGKNQLFERVKTILDRNRTPSFDVSRKLYAGVVGITAFFMILLLRIAPVIAMPDDVSLDVAETPEEVVALSSPEYSGIVGPVRVVEEREESPPEIKPIEAPVSDTEEPPAESNPDEPLTETPEVAANAPVASVNVVGIERPASGNRILADYTELPQPRVAIARTTQVQDDGLSKQSMIRLLKATEKVSSSGDKAQVLVAAAPKLMNDSDVFVAYLNTAATVPSSGDRVRALRALLKDHRLDEKAALRFLSVAKDIPSSGDKSRTLLFALDSRSLPLENAGVSDAFIDTIETVASASDYKRLATRLLSWQRSGEGQNRE